MFGLKGNQVTFHDNLRRVVKQYVLIYKCSTFHYILLKRLVRVFPHILNADTVPNLQLYLCNSIFMYILATMHAKWQSVVDWL